MPGRRGVGGLPIGRVAGIPLFLSWSWLLSALAIGVLATPVVEQSVGLGGAAAVAVALLLAVLLGLSVLVHELGHCLAARSLGIPVLQVRLYLMGGVSELGRAPVSPREEAVVAAAGPGLSAVLTAVFFLLTGSVQAHTVTWLLLVELALANGIVAVFNVLPALPLDGGRVLRAGVWRLSGRRRAGTVAASVGGYVVAAALVVWAGIALVQPGRAGPLQAGIAVATALFVAVGAAGEQREDRGVSWSTGGGLAAVARPVVELPMEVPLELALRAAGSRAVILTGQDGVVAGILDRAAAVAALPTAPRRPAWELARPVTPDQVVLLDDDPAEVAARGAAGHPVDLLLVDDSGRPTGLVTADDARRVLGRSGPAAGPPSAGGREWPGTGSG
ncbi:peptidase M50 [Nakamurella endophytica]|uniref:Zinc metalloprotease n=2 Tax=Nakamurella endophytica TaxID=1748367 RepID=A0A917SQ77_9ACTN|nr:peptidase M50 [Nakamurella endophytica]